MGTFKLDVSGIASCYRTEEGVGIHGAAGGDKKESVGGRHWLWFVVGLVGIVLGIAYGVPRVVGAMFKTPIPQKIEKKTEVPVPVVTNTQTTISRSGDSGSVSVSASVASTNRVRLVGLVRLGSYRQVSLSDGRVLSGGRVQAIGDGWAIIDGHRYEF